MNEPLLYALYYVLPGGVSLGGLLGGRALLRRPAARESFLYRATAMSVLTASILSVLALAWLYVTASRASGFGGLIVLAAPFVPFAIGALIVPLTVSAMVLWSRGRHEALRSRGFLRLPGQTAVNAAVATIVVAVAALGYAVAPKVQQLPYRTLSAEHETGTLTLIGYRYFTSERVDIIRIDNPDWQQFTVSFRLRVDRRGRVQLDVLEQSEQSGSNRTFGLPFKRSSYRLVDGIPVRTDGVSGPIRSEAH